MAGTRLVVHLSLMLPCLVLISLIIKLQSPLRSPLPLPSLPPPSLPTLHILLTLSSYASSSTTDDDESYESSSYFDTSISSVAPNYLANPSQQQPPNWNSRKGYAYTCPTSSLYLIPYSDLDPDIHLFTNLENTLSLKFTLLSDDSSENNPRHSPIEVKVKDRSIEVEVLEEFLMISEEKSEFPTVGGGGGLVLSPVLCQVVAVKLASLFSLINEEGGRIKGKVTLVFGVCSESGREFYLDGMLRETGLGEFIKSIDNLVTGINVEYRRFGKCDLNVNGEKEVKVQDVKGMPVYETSFEVAGDRGKVYKFVVYVPEEGGEIIRIKDGRKTINNYMIPEEGAVHISSSQLTSEDLNAAAETFASAMLSLFDFPVPLPPTTIIADGIDYTDRVKIVSERGGEVRR
ncbi:hypothetical protein TL16_g04070 [Triparma laevis f. inornata]|uniref:Uncharacterized protein n=1 Tax=Triparma laevis f. inornata TaxID=1714386 RepID=A0A9W7A942_9STRA|nr:hypothetical protein TL16_g04070 [Triparma laevis f. inornata]